MDLASRSITGKLLARIRGVPEPLVLVSNVRRDERYESEDALWDISGGADVPDRPSAWLDTGALKSRPHALRQRAQR